MRGRKIKISDKAIIDMMNEGLRNKQIIEETGCGSYTPIYNALRRNNLVRKKGRPKTIDDNKVIELYKRLYSPKEIAIELDCSVDPIYKKIRKYKDNG